MRLQSSAVISVLLWGVGCAGYEAPAHESIENTFAQAMSDAHEAEPAHALFGDGDHHEHEHEHESEHEHDEHEHHHHPHVVLTPEIRRAAARILVLQSTRTEHVTEVMGVVDVHADSGDQDEAHDELRAVALSMGADAVLGVEFHHGETHDAPTHLSGLAVRFRTSIPDPAWR
jgi:hypothetical protein